MKRRNEKNRASQQRDDRHVDYDHKPTVQGSLPSNKVEAWAHARESHDRLLSKSLREGSSVYFSSSVQVPAASSPALRQEQVKARAVAQSGHHLSGSRHQETGKRVTESYSNFARQYLPWSASYEELDKEFKEQANKVEHNERELAIVRTDRRELEVDIDKKMKAARDGMPMEFLFQYNLKEFLMERGGRVIMKAFANLGSHYEKLAWRQWLQFVAWHRVEES